MTAFKNTVTEARVVDVISRLKDAEVPDRDLWDLCQDARECLAYLHAACREWPSAPATILVVGEEDPRMRQALLAANPTEDLLGLPDPILALERMFGVEVEIVDGDPSKDT